MRYGAQMKASEARHLSRLAELGCILCHARYGIDDGERAEIHHLREGQGMAQRGSNWTAIPLCPTCHRGPRGIHGDRLLLKALKLDELDLLAMTIERLMT